MPQPLDSTLNAPIASPADHAIENLRKPISRIVSGLFLISIVFTVPAGFEDGVHEAMEMFGYVLLIVAALGRVWCSVYIAGRKDKELCVLGPYSLCRNPLYLLSFVGVIGFFLAVQSLSMCILGSLAFLLYYRGVIQSEERRLEQLFGDAFRQYRRDTPRFIPSFRAFESRDTLIASPRIIERSLSEVVWFLASIVLIECLATAHSKGLLVAVVLPF